jgi:ABC-2 type transport system ATP-binding protein
MSEERPECEDGLVRLSIPDRTGAIADAVRRLDEVSVGVDDIGISRPTLEDVFITLTGRAPEHEDEPETEPEAA